MLNTCFCSIDAAFFLFSSSIETILGICFQKHDLMQEMKWFAKFDSDGVGGISCSEFKNGFRNIESSGLVDKVTGYEDAIKAIKSYVARSTFAL